MSGRRGPRPRAPFVGRANHLRRHEPFLAELAEFVGWWNRSHPSFAIAPDSVPPNPPSPDQPWPDYLYPPGLGPALEQARQKYPPSPDDDPARAAAFDWLWRLRETCERWWPTAEYPDWDKDVLFASVTMRHPAMVFVGACVLARADIVEELVADPDQWIRPFSLTVRSVPFDPEDYHNHPGVTFYRLCHANLLERLAAATGETLTAELLASADRAARDEAVKVVLFDLGDRKNSYRFIHVPSGLTTTTVRAYLPAIRAGLAESEAQAGAEGPEARARRLRDAGHSVAAIARLLGRDRRTINRWLSEPRPPAG